MMKVITGCSLKINATNHVWALLEHEIKFTNLTHMDIKVEICFAVYGKDGLCIKSSHS